MTTAPMLMSPRNRANSKFDVGPGGRYCNCCDVRPDHNRATRRHVKRSERNIVRLAISKGL